ncbi:transmembrane anchored protein [Aureimonas sp. AU12]|uniref:transmembrane anchored protein n=1 Tax=Aureimonas sp. AU12 TaxID=1638161 RepID=UPI0012E34060|nr:transmembrane anchored protein [Aureimonas sp. AU12]
MKFLTTALFVSAIALSPFAVVTSAKACTNSSDRASDGSRCGDRASGCRPGGRGGIC